MKNILTLIFIIFLSGTTVAVKSQSIIFCTNVDENGNAIGAATTFNNFNNNESLTCLLKSSSPFNQTRYVFKVYQVFSDGTEILDETINVDVYKGWIWTAQKIKFKCYGKDCSFKVTIQDLNDKLIASAKVNVSFIVSGSSLTFVDPEKLAAFEGIWAAMRQAIDPQQAPKKIDLVFRAGLGKNGALAGNKASFSLKDQKSVQVAAYPLDSAAIPSGTLKFNYFLKTNTSANPNASYTIETQNSGKTATHEVTLSAGNWVLKVLDDKGQELGTSELAITP